MFILSGTGEITIIESLALVNGEWVPGHPPHCLPKSVMLKFFIEHDGVCTYPCTSSYIS
jgi:hypothetical protein